MKRDATYTGTVFECSAIMQHSSANEGREEVPQRNEGNTCLAARNIGTARERKLLCLFEDTFAYKNLVIIGALLFCVYYIFT